jgi:hypothetical protein
MTNRIVDRIERKAGVPDLVKVLSEKLGAADLQSLPIEVFRSRTEAGTAGELARRYRDNRFASPTPPQRFVEFDRIAFETLPADFEALELSPLAPLGACAIVAGVSQNRIVTTTPSTEVAADSPPRAPRTGFT